MASLTLLGDIGEMTQLEVYQISLILADATLVGASIGYAASLRGRFRFWAIIASPISACVINMGVLYLAGLMVPNSSGWPADSTWTRMVAGTLYVAIGIGLWGAVPAALASLVFQSHCRYSKRA